MTTRTSQATVTFAKPFEINGIDGVQAPGTYSIEIDEELIEAISFPVWHRTATLFHVRRHGTTQVFRIDPVDLEASLLRDTGQTIVADDAVAQLHPPT